MEGKGEAGEGAWESGLLGRMERGRDRGQQKDGEGRHWGAILLPQTSCSTLPSQGVGVAPWLSRDARLLPLRWVYLAERELPSPSASGM